MKTEFVGECHKVAVYTDEYEFRGLSRTHVIVDIKTEDDGQWFDKMSFDSAWLDELIKLLQEAQNSNVVKIYGEKLNGE